MESHDPEANVVDPGNSDSRPLMFGNYRLERVIGRGTFATVYSAELEGQFGFRKQVALKILKRRVTRPDEPNTVSFLNEARLGAQIRHPNLVEFYECGRIGNRLYIAMELINGPNLAEVLETVRDLSTPINDQMIVEIAMQTARGLDALHSATHEGQQINAVHQDMKPGNILLSEAGQAKLTDYGITRFATDLYTTLGVDGPRGSPLYMSPEQASGVEISQASDVFSFGSTILQLIVGRPVFEASTFQGIMKRVKEADVGDALLAARSRFPHLVPVLENCLMPDPAQRFQNGGELVKGLREIKPPPFGEELVAKLVDEANEILILQSGEFEAAPITKFWDDDEESGEEAKAESVAEAEAPEESTLANQKAAEPEEASASASLPSGDPDPAEWQTKSIVGPNPSRDRAALDDGRRGAVRPWMVIIAVLVIAVGVVMVVPGLRHPLFHAVGIESWETLPDVPDDESDGATADGADPTPAEVEPTTAGDATPAEPVEPPPDPTPAEAVPPPDPTPAEAATPPPDPPDEETTEPQDVVLQLSHRPVTSHARGSDIVVAFTIEPDVRTMCTLSYRAVPGGDWVEKLYVGAHGTVTATIAAGDWQGPDATRVEYFIQLSGRYGEASSGTKAQPHIVLLK